MRSDNTDASSRELPVLNVSQGANREEWTSANFSYEDEVSRRHRLEQEAKDNEHKREQEAKDNEHKREQESKEYKSKLEKDGGKLFFTGVIVSLFFICSAIIVFLPKSTEEQQKNAYTAMGAIVTALVSYYVGNNTKKD